jgi:glycosyltransferase involved in cell wall biosynthesis
VIPCYNEARSLPDLVKRCRVLVGAEPEAEVILVDNGSTDDSPAVLQLLLHDTPVIRSVRVPVNQGYGYGVLFGLNAAEGDILGWTHADLQTDPIDAARGLALFRVGDPQRIYVKGRRYGRPLADRLFTAGMSAFETLLMHTPLLDINAQPNLFHRSFYEAWRNPPHDFSLDLFAYWSAKKAGLTVKRFPVRFGERAFGVSHWNVDWRGKMKFIERTVDFSLKLRAAQAGRR